MSSVIVKERVWPRVNYVPHPAQQRIHRSTARHRVNAGGRRFGKSQIGGHELTPEAFRAYLMRSFLEDKGLRNEFWIVGPNYSDSEKEFRVFYDDCKRLKFPFDKPGTYYNAQSGDMTVSLWEGRFIVTAKSAKYPDSLVGEGLRGVIMAEAAKMKQGVWTKNIRPMLSDFNGWSLFNSTPEGRNWFYDLWQNGQNIHMTDWASWRSPSWLNPHVFPMGATKEAINELLAAEAERRLTEELKKASGVDPEVIAMLVEMSEELFKQEVCALFSEFVGQVFKRFDEEIHVRDFSYDPSMPLYGCVDYGWTNPFVWLDIQVDEWDNVYVLDEHYATQEDTNEVGAFLLRTGRGNAKAFFPDPAEPDDTHTLSKILKVPARTDTGGPLKTRLELIRKWLKAEHNPHLPEGHPQRQPKLLVNRRCKEFIREMNAYRYPESKEEALRSPREEPLDKDNHGPEALGRFFKGYFGKPERRATRVRSAVVSG